MKKDIAKTFIEQYEGVRENLENSLHHIQELMQLRLSQLKAQKGTRARMVDARVKKPGKIWKNAKKRGIPESEILEKTEDLLGIRIVCNNLADAEAVIEMIQHETSLMSIIDIKRMVDEPTTTGYKAIHVRTITNNIFNPGRIKAPCEIQIRTLAQDTWARLSRADLYGKKVPENIIKLTLALSKQLSAIDDIAQLIRDELNQPAGKSKEIEDSESVSPQRLALLYEQIFNEALYEWNLQDWVHNLEEAEVETIGEVKQILNDTRLRDAIDRISKQIRRYPLDNSEWAVLSALVASEIDIPSGIKSVEEKIQAEWDELTMQARSGMLPDSIDDFIDELRNNSIAFEEIFGLLDCVNGCGRCGVAILVDTDIATQAIVDYYEVEDRYDELHDIIDKWRFEHSNSMDGDFCSYCDYQMAKDD